MCAQTGVQSLCTLIVDDSETRSGHAIDYSIGLDQIIEDLSIQH